MDTSNNWNPSFWDTDDVVVWLKINNLSQFIPMVVDHHLKGVNVLQMTKSSLNFLGQFEDPKSKKALLKAVKDLNKKFKKTRKSNDVLRDTRLTGSRPSSMLSVASSSNDTNLDYTEDISPTRNNRNTHQPLLEPVYKLHAASPHAKTMYETNHQPVHLAHDSSNRPRTVSESMSKSQRLAYEEEKYLSANGYRRADVQRGFRQRSNTTPATPTATTNNITTNDDAHTNPRHKHYADARTATPNNNITTSNNNNNNTNNNNTTTTNNNNNNNNDMYTNPHRKHYADARSPVEPEVSDHEYGNIGDETLSPPLPSPPSNHHSVVSAIKVYDTVERPTVPLPDLPNGCDLPHGFSDMLRAQTRSNNSDTDEPLYQNDSQGVTNNDTINNNTNIINNNNNNINNHEDDDGDYDEVGDDDDDDEPLYQNDPNVHTSNNNPHNNKLITTNSTNTTAATAATTNYNTTTTNNNNYRTPTQQQQQQQQHRSRSNYDEPLCDDTDTVYENQKVLHTVKQYEQVMSPSERGRQQTTNNNNYLLQHRASNGYDVNTFLQGHALHEHKSPEDVYAMHKSMANDLRQALDGVLGHGSGDITKNTSFSLDNNASNHTKNNRNNNNSNSSSSTTNNNNINNNNSNTTTTTTTTTNNNNNNHNRNRDVSSSSPRIISKVTEKDYIQVSRLRNALALATANDNDNDNALALALANDNANANDNDNDNDNAVAVAVTKMVDEQFSDYSEEDSWDDTDTSAMNSPAASRRQSLDTGLIQGQESPRQRNRESRRARSRRHQHRTSIDFLVEQYRGNSTQPHPKRKSNDQLDDTLNTNTDTSTNTNNNNNTDADNNSYTYTNTNTLTPTSVAPNQHMSPQERDRARRAKERSAAKKRREARIQSRENSNEALTHGHTTTNNNNNNNNNTHGHTVGAMSSSSSSSPPQRIRINDRAHTHTTDGGGANKSKLTTPKKSIAGLFRRTVSAGDEYASSSSTSQLEQRERQQQRAAAKARHTNRVARSTSNGERPNIAPKPDDIVERLYTNTNTTNRVHRQRNNCRDEASSVSSDSNSHRSDESWNRRQNARRGERPQIARKPSTLTPETKRKVTRSTSQQGQDYRDLSQDYQYLASLVQDVDAMLSGATATQHDLDNDAIRSIMDNDTAAIDDHDHNHGDDGEKFNIGHDYREHELRGRTKKFWVKDDYHHGYKSRTEAEKTLHDVQAYCDGLFLVRKSHNASEPIVSFMFEGIVRHSRIRKTSAGHFRLGNDAVSFPTHEDVINNAPLLKLPLSLHDCGNDNC